MNTVVALTRGPDRVDNIASALTRIADQIDLSQRQCVLIKPNLVSIEQQLPSTHVAALRAVLEFVRARYAGRIVIAEGSAIAYTPAGFERFGYRDVAQHYDAELVDLNADQTIAVQVYNKRLHPQVLRLARTVVESDFRISVGPPKTHDTVIVTLSLKNMIMGSLVNPSVTSATQRPSLLTPRLRQLVRRVVPTKHVPAWMAAHMHLGECSDKLAMHQGFPVINLNLAMLAPWVHPHLAVIDGFQAMEGSGPINGDAVEWRVALAGTDALAVDWLTASLMGFDPNQIGYLHYCQQMGLGTGDLAQITVRGNVDPVMVQRTFCPHPTYQQQRAWYLPDVERRLQPAPQPSNANMLSTGGVP